VASSAGQANDGFDDELDQLRALISQMGGLAENAIRESMRCLIERDCVGAQRVVEDDKKLDMLEAEAERRIVQLISRRAPTSEDLREALAALKISSVVERIGDYAKSIAKRVEVMEDSSEVEPLSLLPEMARIAEEMVHSALDAFVERNPAKACGVCERDRVVDDFYNSIFRALLTFMMENPQMITRSAHLLFVAKNLERIGDHATNIAEMVYFAAVGERLGERQRGLDPAVQQ